MLNLHVRKGVAEHIGSACVYPMMSHGGGWIIIWGYFAGDRLDLCQFDGNIYQSGCGSIIMIE